jgi:hypothetical protein
MRYRSARLRMYKYNMDEGVKCGIVSTNNSLV